MLTYSSPKHIGVSTVLHRLLVPRHPPCALKNLATDARVHCAVLKQRPDTHHPHPTGASSGAGIPEGTIVPSGPNSVPDPRDGDRRSTLRRAVLAIPTASAE